MLTLRTTKTRTETICDGEADPRVTTLISHSVEGRGNVSLSASHVVINDPYGEDDRREFIFYSDSGAVFDAIVDYLADVQREVTRAAERDDLASNRSAQCQLERLRRAAGAMGLTYTASTAAEVA